jgi:queuosine precursor transporter
MVHADLDRKATRLFLILAGVFVANALIAEFMGVKIFSLEKSLGITPFSFSFLGESGLGFNLTAGVLLWPVVFLTTDIINEYFGHRGVRFLSYLTAGLIAYGFIMMAMAIQLEPADFWPKSHISGTPEEQVLKSTKVGDYNEAYRLVFGQGLWIIIGSLVAFLVGQLVDVMVFHKIKAATGEGKIWLRATGSTLISQFIDSFVVLFIAFYIGAGWKLSTVLAIGIMNYIYKFTLAILLTPVIYMVHHWIENYLGEPLATKLKNQAQNQD